jgi:hypothetical protein
VGAWRGLQRGHQQVQLIQLGGSTHLLLPWRRIDAPDPAVVADPSRTVAGSKGRHTIHLISSSGIRE